MIDCCFVNMPYTDLRRPSLALGILQAALKNNRLSAKTIYANLWFIREVGFWFHNLVSTKGAGTLIGDWSFAHLAFPEANIDLDGYFEYYWRCLRSKYSIDPDFAPLREHALQVQKAATDFVDEMVSRILDLKPRIVGCSSSMMQHMASLALIRRIHDEAPDIITLLGGANCEGEMGIGIHQYFSHVDYVVSGEADELIVPLVKEILEKGRNIPTEELAEGVFGPMHRIEGYPSGSCGGRPSAPRAIVSNLRDDQVPDFDDYFETLDRIFVLKESIEPCLPLETSRGCWWKQIKGCTFCGLNGQGKTFRTKMVAQSLETVRKLVKKHKTHQVAFTDNVIDMEYFQTLLPQLAAADWARDCTFFFETRSNLGRNHVKMLRDARVLFVQAGLESLHSDCLRLMNKGCRAYHNIQILKWCVEFGIYVVWHILHDIPGEEDRWYHQMADLIPCLHHLPPPVLFIPIRFDRFSHYYSEPERFNLTLKPLVDYFWLYPIPEEGIQKIAYQFTTAEGEQRRLQQAPRFEKKPGSRRTYKAYVEWHKAWAPFSQRPFLTMELQEDGLLIHDTRPIRAAEKIKLKGLDKDVCLLCEEAVLVDKCIDHFEKKGYTRKAVLKAKDRLIEQKICVLIDDRLLTLAVHRPKAPYPIADRFPFGKFRIDRYHQAVKNLKRIQDELYYI